MPLLQRHPRQHRRDAHRQRAAGLIRRDGRRSGRQDGRRRALVLFTCCFALFIVSLDNTVANVALPSIQRDLHGDVQELQWVLDAYLLVRASLLFSAGALADRFGHRRLFQLGLIGFGAGSILCSLAPDARLLIAFRVLQGIGGAALTPSSLAVIASTFPGRVERARALGFWSATAGASTALGPVVGGALVQSVGWRSVFWINLPIVVIAYVLAGRFMGESRVPAPRPLDLPGQALVLTMLAALMFAFIDAPGAGWGSARIVTLFACSAGLLAAFVAVERRRTSPLLPLSSFRNPPFSGAVAIAILAYTAYSGFIFLNTLYLQEVRGYSPLEAGLLIAPSTIGVLVAAPLSGRLTGHWGPRAPLTAGCLLTLAGMIALSATTPTTSLAVLAAGYVLVGSGIGVANPPITIAAVSGMPADRAGVAGAMSSASRQLGTALGVALLGSIAFTGLASAVPGTLVSPAAGAAFTAGMQNAYVVGAALALAGAITGMLVMGRVRVPSRSSEPY